MNPNAAHLRANEPSDSHVFSARKHFLIVCLIAVAAIGISVLASNGHRAPVTDTATPVSKAPAAPGSSAAKDLAQIAGRPSGSAEKTFDYFPAQFPTLVGEIGEQPPTF